jgi:hypothetical protein
VPVAGKRLKPSEAREWVKGESPLPGADANRYWENVSAEERTVRRQFPGFYLLRLQVNDLTRAMVAHNYLEADAVLDTIKHLCEALRSQLEQVGGDPAFYKARQERGNRAS